MNISILIIGLCNIVIGCSLTAMAKRQGGGKGTKVIALFNFIIGFFLIVAYAILR